MEDDSVSNLLGASRYFKERFRSSRNKSLRGSFEFDYKRVITRLLNVDEGDWTVEYCSAIQEAGRRMDTANRLDSVLKSPFCSTSKKLKALRLNKKLEEKSLPLIVQTLAENEDDLAAVIASIKSANIANNKDQTAFKQRLNAAYAGYANDALRWARSALRLSNNAVTRHVLEQVVSRRKPPAKNTFHTDHDVKTVTFANDGESVLVGGLDTKLYQFSLSGTAKREFDGHTDGIYSILQLGSGEVMTAARDNSLIRWNLDPSVAEPIVNRVFFKRKQNFAPVVHGTMANGFAVTGDPVVLVDLEGQIRHVFPDESRARMLSGDRVVLATRHGKVRIVRIEGDSFIELASIKLPLRKELLSLNANEKYIATGDVSGNVNIWDFDLNLIRELPKMDAGARIVKFRSNSESVLVGTYAGSVYEFDMQGNKLLHFRADTERVYGLDIHPHDPDLLLTGGNDANARLWSIRKILQFQKSFWQPGVARLSLEDLVKNKALTSKHLQDPALLHVTSVTEAAEYFTRVGERYAGDDIIDRAMRSDARAALELLKTDYGLEQAVLDEFEAAEQARPDKTKAAEQARLDKIKASAALRDSSTEPGRCFEIVMGGTIEWGRGTRWREKNAVNLCEGSLNARNTIDCFSAQIDQGVKWPEAILKCEEK